MARSVAVTLVVLLLAAGPVAAADPPRAGGAHVEAVPPVGDDGLTPQERMRKRFPQKVRTGFLVGLPLLDWDDRTLGFVSDVVRRPDGGVDLVVAIGGFPGGWIGGWVNVGARPVAVPIETVAILARQIAALDIPRAAFPTLPTWTPGQDRPIGRDETIEIAVTRR